MTAAYRGRPLRVALVAGSAVGGIRAHVAGLASGLAARGLSVSVIAPPLTLEALGAAPSGVTVTAVPVGSVSPLAARRVTQALRRIASDSDVVHAHGLRAGAAATIARPAAPLVVTWHNAAGAGPIRRGAHRGMERVVARRADLTLAVSPDLAERASGAGASSVSLIEVAVARRTPSRTREAVRAELGVAPDRPLVLAVGRLADQKRMDVLIDAVARWGSAGPVTVIAGAGPLRRRLDARIRDRGASVRLLGHRDDVADLMQAADVLVMTSAWEGWPLTLAEALAAGVPVITTMVGGVPRLVGDAAAAIRVGDPDQTRSVIEQVLGDGELRAAMTARGMQRAAEWQTTDAMLSDLTAKYIQLMSRSS